MEDLQYILLLVLPSLLSSISLFKLYSISHLVTTALYYTSFIYFDTHYRKHGEDQEPSVSLRFPIAIAISKANTSLVTLAGPRTTRLSTEVAQIQEPQELQAALKVKGAIFRQTQATHLVSQARRQLVHQESAIAAQEFHQMEVTLKLAMVLAVTVVPAHRDILLKPLVLQARAATLRELLQEPRQD